MKSIKVKDIMVQLDEYATVNEEATLYEAVLALEKAQKGFDQSQHKHRAILVLDKSSKVTGKIGIFDILIALEPKYGELEATGALSRLGYSLDLIKSMLKNQALWSDPLQFICSRATKLKVSNFMYVPSEGEYIDEDATLGEAIHQLVIGHYNSLLAIRGKEVVGILRLSDVFTRICDKIKTCEL